ncbi:hypothetical protein BWI93_01290 [Siphonobacter sp. BAB-5385]|nr:hypothetical protein BWI93_01290 [Siphonobacter sp. BAB-5385]
METYNHVQCQNDSAYSLQIVDIKASQPLDIEQKKTIDLLSKDGYELYVVSFRESVFGHVSEYECEILMKDGLLVCNLIYNYEAHLTYIGDLVEETNKDFTNVDSLQWNQTPRHTKETVLLPLSIERFCQSAVLLPDSHVLSNK